MTMTMIGRSKFAWLSSALLAVGCATSEPTTALLENRFGAPDANSAEPIAVFNGHASLAEPSPRVSFGA
jgi:hypothetical protein